MNRQNKLLTHYVLNVKSCQFLSSACCLLLSLGRAYRSISITFSHCMLSEVNSSSPLVENKRDELYDLMECIEE